MLDEKRKTIKAHLTALVFFILTAASESRVCPSSTYCICPSDTWLNCAGFVRFEMLNFAASQDNLPYEFIHLEPAKYLPLDKEVNLNGVLASSKENSLIRLERIDSFQFEANPFGVIKEQMDGQIGRLELVNSHFKFTYLDNVTLLADKCRLDFVDVNAIRPMLAEFKRVILGDTVKYEQWTCPFAFKSVRIQSLSLYNLSDENTLRFRDDFMSIAGNQLDSRVNTLEIYQSSLSILDASLLNAYVFKHVEHLVISETRLGQVEPTLFANFEHILTIQLRLSEFDSFFKGKNF